MNIPGLKKLKKANNNDFDGFIENPNKDIKKDFLENKHRRALIIINPIFDSEVNQNDNEPTSLNSRHITINHDNFNSHDNFRRVNVSDKLSIGFIV